jgi:hypothetical protein
LGLFLIVFRLRGLDGLGQLAHERDFTVDTDFKALAVFGFALGAIWHSGVFSIKRASCKELAGGI